MRGAFFQTTFASHGYVFVTPEAFLPELLHVGQGYKLLRQVQDSSTSVCLVNIDLKRTYHPNIGVKVIYVPFISWDRTRLTDDAPVLLRDVLHRTIRQSTDEVRDLGVEH